MGRDIGLALLSSIITVLGTVALAAIVFAGPAAPAAPLGFMMLLFGTAIAGAVVGLLSRFACNLSGAQDQPAAILGAIALGLAPMGLTTIEAAVSTLVAIVFASTLLFGIALLLLGSLGLGKLTQLIPYPVVGGFLASVGVLVLSATLGFLTGHPAVPSNLSIYVDGTNILRWLPALAVAVALHYGMGRIRQALFIPAVLTAFVGVFHLSAWLAGVSLDRLRRDDWLFASFPEGGVTAAFAWLQPGAIDLGAMAGAASEIGALVLICTIGASLAITAVEIGTERELDPNSELRAHGIANIAAAAVGCIPCFTLTGPTIAYHRLGARTRWMPLLRAAFSLAIGLAGLPLLAYVPKMAVGALLFLFAFGFIVEWLMVARRRMEWTDYALVLLIVGFVVLVGFLEGIGVGILIAAVFFMIKYGRLDVVKSELSVVEYRSNVERPFDANRILAERGNRLMVFELQGYVFFGSAMSLLDRIRHRIERDRHSVRYVILGCRHLGGMDASAAFALKKLKLYAQANDISLLFANLEDADAGRLIAAGVMAANERFPETGHAMEWVEDRLLAEAGYQTGEVAIKEILNGLLTGKDGTPALLPYLKARDVAAGEFLFREGDPNNDIYILIRGKLSAMLRVGQGDAIRLRKFLPGSVVGEMAFYAGGRRSASLVADTAARVFVMSGSDLQVLEKQDPAVAGLFHGMIARLMAQRLIAMNDAVRHLVE